MLFDGRPLFAPFPARLSLAFLEWGLNWCIANHACQFLIIHGAVLERGGQAAILPGPPGSGKSTVCAAMTQRGWRLISDELSLISPDDGHVVPMPRPISLKNDSISIIQALNPQSVFGPARPTTRKGKIAHLKPPRESVERSDTSVPPRWVIFPRYNPASEVSMASLARSRAFLRLAESSFNYSYLGVTGFEMTKRLIGNCDCFELSYGNVVDALNCIDSVCGMK